MSEAMAMLEDARTARLALSPLRRRLLARLRTPTSATALSEEFQMPRQKIGYHLRLLEKAGLLTEAGSRQRRGFTEKLFETRSDALLVDPMILAPADPDVTGKQDRFAAEHLVRAAAGIVRDVSRMRAAAEEEGSRLLTFTVEADVAFAQPADIARFTDRLADAVAAIAADFAPQSQGRAYRITIAGHPAAGAKAAKQNVN